MILLLISLSLSLLLINEASDIKGSYDEDTLYVIENDKALENTLANMSNTVSGPKAYLYMDGGDLMFGSSSLYFSEDISLYFDPYSYSCFNKSENRPGLFIDLIFCIEEGTYCTNGMTICYKPQFTKSNLKAEHEKNALSKINNNVECKNDGEHGIKVQIDEFDYVRVQISFDKHVYKFRLPEKGGFANRCFKIKLGDETSIEAIITNMNDKKLVFTGASPLNLKDSIWYSNKEFMNFWLLTLDFIPMRNKYFGFNKFEDYTMEFHYKKDKTCRLATLFRGDQNMLGCGLEILPKDKSYGGANNAATDYTENYQRETIIRRTTIHEQQEGTEKGTANKIGAGYSNQGLSINYEHMWNTAVRKHSKVSLEEGQTDRWLEQRTLTIHVPANHTCFVYEVNLRCMGWRIKNLYEKYACKDSSKSLNGVSRNKNNW